MCGLPYAVIAPRLHLHSVALRTPYVARPPYLLPSVLLLQAACHLIAPQRCGEEVGTWIHSSTLHTHKIFLRWLLKALFNFGSDAASSCSFFSAAAGNSHARNPAFMQAAKVPSLFTVVVCTVVCLDSGGFRGGLEALWP